MVSAMDGINASSQKISKIIKVIDEIAFQTNILALNAAVEAARAGEAGMGFAVVADEVRNLAQRCAQAAKDTADLIEESIQRSDGGRVKVDQVAVAIRAITAESAKIKVLVDEINLGSVEQSQRHRPDQPGDHPDGAGDPEQCGQCRGERSRGGGIECAGRAHEGRCRRTASHGGRRDRQRDGGRPHSWRHASAHVNSPPPRVARIPPPAC